MDALVAGPLTGFQLGKATGLGYAVYLHVRPLVEVGRVLEVEGEVHPLTGRPRVLYKLPFSVRGV